jgi:hypothetical protein
LRRNVPPLRRVLFDECKDDESRVSYRVAETRGQRTPPPSRS